MKMQIKTSMWCPYTFIQAAKIKNDDNVGKGMEKLDHLYIAVGNSKL